MGILSANLKHFYQRRGLYLVYAFYALLLFGLTPALLTERGDRRGGLAVLLTVISFAIGLLVGVTQLEVASKPFAFCLPGHRGAVRRLAFLIGVIASLVLGLPYLPYLAQPFSEPLVLVLVLFSGSCANLIAYLVGLAFGLSVWNAASAIGFIVPGALALTYLAGGTVIAQSILHRPDLMIVLGIGGSVAGWLWLGRPAWFRKRCARPWVGMLDAWDRSKMHKFRQVWTARRFTKPPHPGIDAFFLGKIGRYGSADPRRYIWGTLYTTYALIAPQWKGWLFLVLIAVAWAGYARGAALFIIPMLGVVMVGFINPPLYSELPVAGSRRARSFATMGQVLALAATWALVIGLAVVVVNCVMLLAPETEVAGFPLSFQPVDLNMLLLPVAVFPGVGIVRMLFYRNPVYLMLGTMLLLGLMMMAALIMSRLPVPMSYVAAAAVVLWAVCFLVIHEIAMRRDLVAR